MQQIPAGRSKCPTIAVNPQKEIGACMQHQRTMFAVAHKNICALKQKR
jgi:hypothetical protein